MPKTAVNRAVVYVKASAGSKGRSLPGTHLAESLESCNHRDWKWQPGTATTS